MAKTRRKRASPTKTRRSTSTRGETQTASVSLGEKRPAFVLSEDIQLEDLLPDPIDVDDPQLQRKLALLPEYAELAGEVSEEVPAQGEFYKHQRVILRYLRTYDRLFLFHKMGTGKTCAMKSIAGYYKNKYYPITQRVTDDAREIDQLGFGGKKLQEAVGLPTFIPTQSSVAVSAFVSALVELMEAWDSDIRHAFILVKSPSLKAEFERQITCECALKGEFVLGDFDNETQKRNAVRKEVAKWFTIETTGTFVIKYMCHRVNEKYVMKTVDELQRQFSHCLFVVDEVDGLYSNARFDLPSALKPVSPTKTPVRKGSKTPRKSTPKGGTRRTKSDRKRVPLSDQEKELGLKEIVREIPVIPRQGEEVIGRYEFVYDALWTLFHLIENGKVLLSTGTPMVNASNEIKSVMNLILETNHQMPDQMDVNRMSLEELEPYFRGLVSFVRELDTGIEIEYMGEPYFIKGINQESSTNVMMSTMSPFQTDVYMRTAESSTDEIDLMSELESEDTSFESTSEDDGNQDASFFGEDFEEGGFGESEDDFNTMLSQMEIAATQASIVQKQGRVSEFKSSEMAASLFVFPDESIRGVASKTRQATTQNSGLGKYVYSLGKGRYEATPDYYKQINTLPKIKKLSSIYHEIFTSLSVVQGKWFVYMGRFVQGPGAINASVCAKAILKYEQYDGDVSAFVTSGSKKGRVCITLTQRTLLIPKGKRFALITGATTLKQRDNILALWRAPENVHGEYLQGIIGSKTMGVGFNLDNTIEGHFLLDWNRSITLQAFSRMIRTTSHVQLLKEARAAHGPDARVNVKIFFHAAVPDVEDGEDISIDLKLFSLSEIKDRQNKRIERFLKQSAVDCVIHYRRNARPGKEGSAECDYGTCLYECAAPRLEDSPDLANLDLVLSKGRRLNETAVLPVTPMYLTRPLFHSMDLMDKLLYELKIKRVLRISQFAFDHNADLSTMYETLRYAMHTVTKDRYGFPGTLHRQGDYVYFVRGFEYPNGLATDPLSSQYQSIMSLVPSITMSMVQRAIGKEEAEEESLDLQRQAFEKETMELALGRIKTSAIANKLAAYLFTFKKPEADLEKARIDKLRRGQGRGRKAKSDTHLKLTFEPQLIPIETGEKAVRELTRKDPNRVFVHTLEGRSESRTSYAVSSRVQSARQRLRVLESNLWRDATIEESAVYDFLISAWRDAEIQKLGDLYGSVLEDRNFRIHDNTLTQNVKSKRDVARGRICHTWDLGQLMDVVYRAGLRPDQVYMDEAKELDRAERNHLLGSQPVRLSKKEIKEMKEDRKDIEAAWRLFYQDKKMNLGDFKQYICATLQPFFKAQGKLIEAA